MQIRRENLSLDEKVWEFDLWVTPAISDIRSSARYKAEMARVLSALKIIASGPIPKPERFSADLTDRVLNHLGSEVAKLVSISDKRMAVVEALNSLSVLLFLVTGKSDNNQKCQLPIFLRNKLGWKSIPFAARRGGQVVPAEEAIPRVLDSEKYLGRVASLYLASFASNGGCRNKFQQDAATMLLEFIKFLLNDYASQQQLSAFLSHYRERLLSKEDPSSLLVPLVIFQVRGSVAASGGHEPEEILRLQMADWGLRRDIDFNSTDVVVDHRMGAMIGLKQAVVEVASGRKEKTRAYDFVIPFQTFGWHPRIFIQSQFYAGDSGSVSHKNVDQTKASRQSITGQVKAIWPTSETPQFVEYVDGAGYCASLHGDLKSLLSYKDTTDFFQVKSAPVRLRRLLQEIGFLTPLDLAHAILRGHGVVADALKILTGEGYSKAEIDRCRKVCEDMRLVSGDAIELALSEEFLPLARRYLLLDAIAQFGRPFGSIDECVGVALIPGFGPYYGIPLDELDRHLNKELSGIWRCPWLSDIQDLCREGFVILR